MSTTISNIEKPHLKILYSPPPNGGCGSGSWLRVLVNLVFFLPFGLSNRKIMQTWRAVVLSSWWRAVPFILLRPCLLVTDFSFNVYFHGELGYGKKTVICRTGRMFVLRKNFYKISQWIVYHVLDKLLFSEYTPHTIHDKWKDSFLHM